MKVQVFRYGEDAPYATLILSVFELPRVGDYMQVYPTAKEKKKNPQAPDSMGSNVMKVIRTYKNQVLKEVRIRLA